MNGAVKTRLGSRSLLIVDSVTECGRLRPDGRGSPYTLRPAAARPSQTPFWNPSRSVALSNSSTWARAGTRSGTSPDGGTPTCSPSSPTGSRSMIAINNFGLQYHRVDPASSERLVEFWDIYGGLVAHTRLLLKGRVLMAPYHVQGDGRGFTPSARVESPRRMWTAPICRGRSVRQCPS